MVSRLCIGTLALLCIGGQAFPPQSRLWTMPSVVQSAYGRSNAGYTITLSATPTPGNLLLWLASGNGLNGIIPAEMSGGFGTWDTYTYTVGNNPNNGTAVYEHVVQSGDGVTYTVSGIADYVNSAIIEISGASKTDAGQTGIPQFDGTKTLTGSPVSVWQPALVFSWFEMDAACAATPSPAASYTLLNAFGTGGGSHPAALVQLTGGATTPGVLYAAPAAAWTPFPTPVPTHGASTFPVTQTVIVYGHP